MRAEQDRSSLALLQLLRSLQETPKLPIDASSIAELQSRIERKQQQGKGVSFSAEEVDILAAIGVGELIALASARHLKQLAVARIYQRAGLPIPSAESEEQTTAPAATEEPRYTGPKPAQAVAEKPYTIARLADRWRVSPENVRARIKSGELEAFQIGPRTYRIRPEVVQAYEAARMS